MQEHLEKCANAASEHISSLIEQEHEPFTTNMHYFMEYRSKFFAHYKGARLREKNVFIQNMQKNDDSSITQAMNDAVSALTKMGLEGADVSLLANLIPPDPMDPAIGIMADVRAYFQGSYFYLLIYHHPWLTRT